MVDSEIEKVIAIIDRKWNQLSTTDNQQFYRYFRRLWEYVRNNPLSNEILEQLLYNRDTPLLKQLDGKLASKEDAENLLNGNWTYFDKNAGGEERDIALFIRLMDKVAGPKWVENINNSKKKKQKHWVDVMYNLAMLYVNPNNKDKYHSINLFFSLFLVPILEHVKDNLNTNVLVLDTLKKFKQKCEWFDQETLINTYQKDTSNGETNLKKFLYKHLFNQGIQFSIEPTSPSGAIDLLLQQTGEEKIGCEGKIYDGKNRASIIHGIENQLTKYLQEHNLPTGYMVIFKVAKRKLIINLNEEQGLSYIDIRGKRIYLIIIDIYKGNSASVKENKDKKLKDHVISKGKLGTIYFYYHCNYCGTRFKANNAEEFVKKEIEKVVPNKPVLKFLHDLSFESYQANKDFNRQENNKYVVELNKLKSRIQTAQNLMLDGQLDAADYKEIKQKNEEEIRKIERYLTENKTINADLQAYLKYAYFFLNSPQIAFAEATLEGKQQIVGSTFVQKIILEEKKGRTPTLNPFIALCAKPVKGLKKTKKDCSVKKDEQSREVELKYKLSNNFYENLRQLALLV